MAMSGEESMAARIATEVRVELARRRMSGRDLARMIGVPHTTMARWLRGETPFGIDELDAVARALNITVIDLWQAAAASRPLSPSTDKNGAPGEIRTRRPADYKVAVPRPRRPRSVQPTITNQEAA